ncbi:MAG: polymerase ECF-type sigma factor [Fibrobacteres bacterium]|nr:polymerase ECF-type sigma factor [Fibrobacterota bacterium]
MRFSPMVFSIGLSILKTREDAEDLVQDMFAHKVPALLSERPDLTREELGRVLAVSARNLCIDRYRRKRRFPESELDPEIHGTDGAGTGTDTEDGALGNPESLLEGLKPKYREVLTLKYLWSMTWEEVSIRLGISQAGARKRAGLARQDILARHPGRGAYPGGDGPLPGSRKKTRDGTGNGEAP